MTGIWLTTFLPNVKLTVSDIFLKYGIFLLFEIMSILEIKFRMREITPGFSI